MEATNSTFAGRLTALVEESKKSRAAFARAVGVGDTTLKNYMSGDTEPGVREIVAVCDLTGALVAWLITGMGPKYVRDLADPAVYGNDPRYVYSRDLVMAVVLAMEEELQAAGMNPSPKKRADLVAAFCFLFKRPDDIEREAIRMMIKAAG